MTRREEIIRMLEQNDMSVHDLAEHFKIDVGDVSTDLIHVLKSVKRSHKIVVIPPRCRQCGFEFKDRKKTRPPSKCPECDSEAIDAARYKLEHVSPEA